LEKDARKRFRDGHHLLEELKALQRSLPSMSWEKEGTEGAAAPPPPPPAKSPSVIEWASRAGLFARMTARAYPSSNSPQDVQQALGSLWELAAKANSLEGEIASHTRKLEALERRGRALRAEIGRKVEELAQEESRCLREAAAYAEEEESARGDLSRAQQVAREKQAIADQAERTATGNRAVYEACGAAKALIDAKRDWLRTREERRAAKEAVARELRRQIEELRSQLARYAEALEDDLQAGREKVANRSREGIRLEKAFQDASNILVGHLKGKPECRELMSELNASNAPQNNSSMVSSGLAQPPPPPQQRALNQ